MLPEITVKGKMICFLPAGERLFPSPSVLHVDVQPAVAAGLSIRFRNSCQCSAWAACEALSMFITCPISLSLHMCPLRTIAYRSSCQNRPLQGQLSCNLQVASRQDDLSRAAPELEITRTDQHKVQVCQGQVCLCRATFHHASKPTQHQPNHINASNNTCPSLISCVWK